MLRLAKVTRAHPEDHSVDLLMLDTADRVPGVQVLGDFAGTDFGESGLVEPDQVNPDDPWSPRDTKTRDLLAVVGQIRQSFVVIGFLFPQVAQALFARKNFRVKRYPSDVYTTVDDAGNVEVAHPSGTFIRIGESLAHEDLTGQDFDRIWQVTKNTGRSVGVRVEVGGGGGGARRSTWTMAADGTVTLDATAPVTVVAPSLLVDAPQSTFTGTVTVAGLFTFQASMVGTGTAAISGAVTAGGAVSAPAVSAGGISLGSHRHSGVQGGSGTSGGPV